MTEWQKNCPFTWMINMNRYILISREYRCIFIKHWSTNTNKGFFVNYQWCKDWMHAIYKLSFGGCEWIFLYFLFLLQISFKEKTIQISIFSLLLSTILVIFSQENKTYIYRNNLYRLRSQFQMKIFSFPNFVV